MSADLLVIEWCFLPVLTTEETSSLKHRHDVGLQVGDVDSISGEVKVVDEALESDGRSGDTGVVAEEHRAPVTCQSQLCMSALSHKR